MNCREEDVNVLDAAAALILLRNRSTPDRPPPPGNPHRPPDLAAAALGFKLAAAISLPPWGIRLRRSACVCRSKREHDESSSSSAAAEAAACSRPSPPTPLDYPGTSSDPSTSGSDGLHTSSEISPVKRLRSGDASAPRSISETKDSAPGRSPLVEAAVTTWRPIRRQGKKKTISELQAQEMSLMEENSLLVKLVESKRKDVEILFAENRSLKSESTSLKMQIEPAAAAAESTKTAFLLPDLNEPVLMDSPDS